jgi:hypothetical protein
LCYGESMMNKLILAAAGAAAASLAMPAAAGPRPAPPVGQEARIPFASMGGIRSFHAEDDDIVYLQDYRRRWYRAELVGPCFGLRWAMRIAVDTRGSSAFDRSSALLVGDERCMLGSLTYSGPPPRRASKRRHAS